MEQIGVSLATSALGSIFSRKGKKQSKGFANSIIPQNIDTGNSQYNTKTGKFSLDPSIRAGQDQYASALGGLRGDINNSFGEYNTGLDGLSGQLDGMRADYIGNQSAYEDSMLNPIRSQIAKREGSLSRELNRTGVRGSFANQSRTNLAMDSSRTLSDAKAQVENQRINKLGDFLQMDADILKQGLASDQGRINMMASLENSLSSISTERFNQEMQMLGMPAQFASGNASAASMNASAQGNVNAADSKLAGSLVEGIGSLFGGGNDQNNFMEADFDSIDNTWGM